MLALLLNSAAAQEDGFVSIDCQATSNFTDPISGFVWTTDEGFVGMGKNKAVQASVNDNARQMQSLRFFSPYRSKHCYTLPAVYNSSYILRAMLLYSNFQAASDQYSFDVSIDSNLADTVNITSAEVDTPQVSEYIDICLLPVDGPPIISSLELRPLAPGMYDVVHDGKYLKNIIRLNCGTSVRYPEDPYDRLWSTPGPSDTEPPAKSSRIIVVTDDNFDKPPMVVMQTAWLDSTVWWFTPIPQYELQRTAYYYTHLFFCRDPDRERYRYKVFECAVQQFSVGPWLVDVTTSSFNEKRMLVNTEVEIYTGGVNFTLSAPPNATLDPLLNAAEIYASRAVVVLRTNDVDVNSHLLPVASLKVRKAASTGLCSRMRIGDMRFCQHSSFHNVDESGCVGFGKSCSRLEFVGR
ncbi:hypothetical protein MPTK1_4g03330 [Marchantia polymorpha subsp. ruderalis]|uniref:Malectin-like domain-containing protein n=2 Tax=Marchantia polymorpha TaxID=3197 RepID=A0AAF6B5U0_MARPO|nr:hypothetical protein MARPO_0228s0004 [Marchantia polymorpha]PTQ27068.1 hypothetical protein MARPO_0228s0004 [Marchantia polymorpha]BBN07373.1 hypothetical protein Mp_4g03330 [Marchantia polymorpha subsp. ruderalis]BBN07374.1 hypothetical protein Mp_4g03330 [Marchantia polymorpha subsp. ruderalis]|eukprot:PTQ27067.1 hypothetical protein MARPO_0228s0004 [Marchantia polymorpha]